MLLQACPLSSAHDEQVVDVTGIALGRHVDRRAGQRASGRAPRALRRRAGPLAQKRQARAQHRRLHLVEPRVDAGVEVMVAVGLAAVAEAAHAFGERRVVGDDRAAIAQRAEILGRVEAEGARDADGADRPSRGSGQVRLAASSTTARPCRAASGSSAAMSAACP